jgi:7,8-dihydro-6-hydroxymethylpterin dimethyltransferase
LRRIRREALENLERHGLSTTLVVTVKRGVNDHEIGDIIRHALTWTCVRGVTLQPVQDAGRNENFNKDTDRIMLSEIRRRVVETGVFGEADMIPLPCNPESISIGYGLRNGEAVLPLTSLIPQDQLLAVMPNTISPEKYRSLREKFGEKFQEKFREKFLDLFSLSSGPLNTGARVAELLCCLPTFEVPDGLTYENVFRVTIVQFLDRFNFCVGNVKRSCIHFVTPNGEIIPFDTYNLFYRNGKIDGIRASMAAETVRAPASGGS